MSYIFYADHLFLKALIQLCWVRVYFTLFQRQKQLLKTILNRGPKLFQFLKYSVLLFEKKIAHPLQNYQCIKTGQNVIQHDANSMGNPFALSNGEGF